MKLVFVWFAGSVVLSLEVSVPFIQVMRPLHMLTLYCSLCYRNVHWASPTWARLALAGGGGAQGQLLTWSLLLAAPRPLGSGAPSSWALQVAWVWLPPGCGRLAAAKAWKARCGTAFAHSAPSGADLGISHSLPWGLPRWLSGTESLCQCRTCRRCEFDPWVEKIPWRRK